jgi:hypothetical protein
MLILNDLLAKFLYKEQPQLSLQVLQLDLACLSIPGVDREHSTRAEGSPQPVT